MPYVGERVVFILAIFFNFKNDQSKSCKTRHPTLNSVGCSQDDDELPFFIHASLRSAEEPWQS